MENKSTSFKYCIATLCKNTTVRTPNKIFLRLPNNENRRSQWIRACRRDQKGISITSGSLHVCEDHFNLEKDMDNYIKFKLMGGQKRIKPGVIPHIFDCQPDRKTVSSQHLRPATPLKRANCGDPLVSTSTSSKGDLGSIQLEPNNIELFEISSDVYDSPEPAVSVEDVSTQIRPKFRSKSIQCRLDCGITVGLSPLKVFSTEVGTSQIKPILQVTASVKSVNESATNGESCEDKSYSILK